MRINRTKERVSSRLRVLLNAVGILARGDTREKIDLLQRARKLDPALGTEPLARLYSAILVSPNEPEIVFRLTEP
jgi:hypothetical protein